MEPSSQPALTLCPVCHQTLLPSYYYCPNCGTKVNAKPLSTSLWAQAGLYLFSIILPMIGFIFVTKWQGSRYFNSLDPKLKRIGLIAWILLLISTIVTIYLAYVWTLETINSVTASINTDMGF